MSSEEASDLSDDRPSTQSCECNDCVNYAPPSTPSPTYGNPLKRSVVQTVEAISAFEPLEFVPDHDPVPVCLHPEKQMVAEAVRQVMEIQPPGLIPEPMEPSKYSFEDIPRLPGSPPRLASSSSEDDQGGPRRPPRRRRPAPRLPNVQDIWVPHRPEYISDPPPEPVQAEPELIDLTSPPTIETGQEPVKTLVTCSSKLRTALNSLSVSFILHRLYLSLVQPCLGYAKWLGLLCTR